MTVTLPDTMRDELSLKARSAGFRDVDTYVAYLVVADDGDGVDEFADAEFAIPEELALISGTRITVANESWANGEQRLPSKLKVKNLKGKLN